MRTATMSPGWGAIHVGDVALMPHPANATDTTPATREAAWNFAASCMLGVATLQFAAGMKSGEPTLLVQTPGGVTIGDGGNIANGADTANWGARMPSVTAQDKRRIATVYAYAMDRALRALVLTSGPSSEVPTQLQEDHLTPSIIPPLDGDAQKLGAIPLGPLIVLGVVGVAAMAAGAWAAPEVAQKVCTMRVAQAQLAATLAFNTQIAKEKMAAGQPVDFAPWELALANAEKRESIWLPIGLGIVGGVAIAAGVAKAVS